MPLKHLTDYEIQNLANRDIINPEFEKHLNECPRCKTSYEFYCNMFSELSNRVSEGFSSTIAIDTIKEIARIQEKTQRWKLNFVFLLLIVISSLPFILFPEVLGNIFAAGTDISNFLQYILSVLRKYNLGTLPIFASVLLIALIHLLDLVSRRSVKKKH